ncbi:tRNA (adenosine(37)-N6)-dimethylallyltransferase MiaA [Halomonas halocynthiae]|uniref:tRNA (adenosine(37)-N6)-dimethylallyltransferase MiaA n=1 Tax=Halomonas halocynthiae TaxID=176290 RepID=UPI000404242C|nr:tRNA (adenosine(37)-N6)-dimethylallyltransferase MiaA [Halomonas halocynthiae]
MNDTRPTAIFLMGPTAAGKTDLAITLHDEVGAELISVDSTMVYRGLDVGSAKPSAEELARAPHRLIDIRDPADPYSAAEFRHDARHQMRMICDAGSVPLLVGGTMLYFNRLQQGVANLPEAQPQLRAELNAQAEQYGLAALHDELSRVDPVSAKRIHPNDPQRLMRALEVFRHSGRTLTELWQQQQTEPFPWRVLPIGLAPADRGLLHERIAQRFDSMLEAGLLEEVAALKRRDDLHPYLPAMKSVGYRQAWQYLDGKIDKQRFRQDALTATRQLAKRQLTWMRSWPDLTWIDPTQANVRQQVAKLVRKHSS